MRFLHINRNCYLNAFLIDSSFKIVFVFLPLGPYFAFSPKRSKEKISYVAFYKWTMKTILFIFLSIKYSSKCGIYIVVNTRELHKLSNYKVQSLPLSPWHSKFPIFYETKVIFKMYASCFISWTDIYLLHSVSFLLWFFYTHLIIR